MSYSVNRKSRSFLYRTILPGKELFRRIEAAGNNFEWPDIRQDLKALQVVTMEKGGKRFAIRTECRGIRGQVFQAVGVAVPPTIREITG